MKITDSLSLRQILVPLDGSHLAEEALPLARTIARRVGATLHLVAVLPPSVPPGAQFGMDDRDDPYAAAARDDTEAYLAMMAVKLHRAEGPIPVHAVLTGWPAERLADYITERNVGLVVMTTHGRGGFSRFWLGSVADQLVHRVHVPLLLLRHGGGRDGAAFTRVTVAMDGSAAAERALAAALAVGLPGRDTRYSLVRVVPPPAPGMVTPVGLYPAESAERPTEELRVEATSYLETVAERLRAEGYLVDPTVVVGGVPGQIMGTADRNHSQLIALGTRAINGIDRLLLGSVADKVVRSAAQPVLVVPSPAAQPAGPILTAAAPGRGGVLTS